MNYTCKRNQTLSFFGSKSQALLSFRGIKLGAAYFHVIWEGEDAKAYPFYLTPQEKLIIGKGVDAIDISIVGFTANACSFYCDLPNHIMLIQSELPSVKIQQLRPSRIEIAKVAIQEKLEIILKQQAAENDDNSDSLLDVLTLLREIIEGVEIDMQNSLKKEKRIAELLEKF